MRKILLVLTVVLFSCNTKSQEIPKDLQQYYVFMQENSVMWDEGSAGEYVKPFAMKTPDGQTIVSDSLRGKVVVLDFWATWCAPCRQLTQELDELLSKYYDGDFLMIGVNYLESIKQGDPVEYWHEKGYRFPMTVGNNEYGDAIGAGNPTIFVVDKGGIVRGKFQGWTDNKAEEIQLLVEILMGKAPEISVESVVDLNRRGESLKALYVYETVAAINPEEGKMLSFEKFKALLHINEWGAVNFAKEWRSVAADPEQALSDIAAGIAETNGLSPEIYAYGAETFEELVRDYRLGDNLIVQDLMGRCYFRAGNKEKALVTATESLRLAREQDAPHETLEYLESVLTSYQ